MEISKGGTNIDGEAQVGGRNGRTKNGADELERRPVQVVVHAGSRDDVSAHGFWKQGNTAMFDIRIVNLNTRSYLHMTL